MAKPSWMGDYSVGQVSGALQGSGDQKTSANPTLEAMFGGRSKRLSGGGEGRVKKQKHKQVLYDTSFL